MGIKKPAYSFHGGPRHSPNNEVVLFHLHYEPRTWLKKTIKKVPHVIGFKKNGNSKGILLLLFFERIKSIAKANKKIGLFLNLRREREKKEAAIIYHKNKDITIEATFSYVKKKGDIFIVLGSEGHRAIKNLIIF